MGVVYLKLKFLMVKISGKKGKMMIEKNKIIKHAF